MPRKKLVNARSNKWYGWLPDLPDHRDFFYSAIAPRPTALPTKVDLRSKCSAIEDQGSLGSCTANALVGALEFLELKDLPADATPARNASDAGGALQAGGTQFVDFSRLFIYYNERMIEGTVDQDSGAFIRDGMKSLAKQGVCSEEQWPYRISAFTRKPTAACYRAAMKHQITSYYRIITIQEMRTCLAEGFPFVFGFTVYDAFESAAVARSGVVNMPRPNESVVGGHAVMAVGYDDTARRFMVRNSWGTDWGQKGNFTMPYDYLAPDNNLSDDFWTIRILELDEMDVGQPG